MPSSLTAFRTLLLTRWGGRRNASVAALLLAAGCAGEATDKTTDDTDTTDTDTVDTDTDTVDTTDTTPGDTDADTDTVADTDVAVEGVTVWTDSFEAPVLSEEFQPGIPSGWTAVKSYVSTGLLSPSLATLQFTAADGNQLAYFSFPPMDSGTSVTTIDAVTTVTGGGQVFTVTAQVGRRVGFGVPEGNVSLALLINGVERFVDTLPAAGLPIAGLYATLTAETGTIQADVGQPVQVRITADHTSADSYTKQLLFDDVRVRVVTPEILGGGEL